MMGWGGGKVVVGGKQRIMFSEGGGRLWKRKIN